MSANTPRGTCRILVLLCHWHMITINCCVVFCFYRIYCQCSVWRGVLSLDYLLAFRSGFSLFWGCFECLMHAPLLGGARLTWALLDSFTFFSCCLLFGLLYSMPPLTYPWVSAELALGTERHRKYLLGKLSCLGFLTQVLNACSKQLDNV